MPVEFLQQEPSGGSSHATRLVMMYDGSGRRISKTAMRMVGDDGWDTTLVTHYTGIGTETREYKPANFTRYTDSAGVEHCVSANPDYGGNASTACPLPDTVKVAVPLPQGLGRYALQDADHQAEEGAPQAFEWYLKNHLGSTMVVYGTGFPDPLGISPEGELRAAYDYRSFGEQLDLLVFTRKVTENFTGKEKDDETQLDYFGARYLDPMLGLWISVDPARQFDSPYLYVGNGYNPIIGVDEDGNEIYKFSFGMRGAVIIGGLFNVSLVIDSDNLKNSDVQFTVGVGVGLEVGTKSSFKKIGSKIAKTFKTASKGDVNASDAEKVEDFTGIHSETAACVFFCVSASDNNPKDLDFQFGSTVGGGYYKTFTTSSKQKMEGQIEDVSKEDFDPLSTAD